MAGKNQKGVYRAENDIEKNREDGNWARVIELADLLIRSKPPLYNFLIGEAKLETYLEQYPPIEANVSKARIGLAEAKHHLLESITDEGNKCGVSLDGHLLLAKLHYTVGDYDSALDHYKAADLQSLTEKVLAPRSICIIAESYSIKGLCLEKHPPIDSKYARTEWVEQIVRCYELASDLGLLYLQQIDNKLGTVANLSLAPPNAAAPLAASGAHTPQPASISRTFLTIVIEDAIPRAPNFFIENRKITSAVNYYRNVLSAMETNTTYELRLTFCRQLAEILIRRISAALYYPPEDGKKITTTSLWKPRRFISGFNTFVPRNKYEEGILLLLISDAMAAKNAVLSQSPEFKDARVRAFSNAVAIYDLLTIVLSQWKQYSILQQSFERAMKFSSDEPHVWMQQALCLEATEQHNRALSMMKQVIRLTPAKTLPCLIAARIAYQGLCNIDEGLEWSQKALSCEQSNPQNLLSRCYLYIGIGAHCKSRMLHVKSLRDKYTNLAFDSFARAQQVDPNDHLIKYYLALHSACQFQLSDALSYVKKSLKLQPEHLASLHLMILLLSAQKQMAEANQLLESTIQDYPHNVPLKFLKIYLQLQMQNTETALYIGKHLLSVWKVGNSMVDITGQNVYSDNSDNNHRVFLHLASEFSDRDSNNLHAPQALVVSRTEQALSEVASSFDSSYRRLPLTNTTTSATTATSSNVAWAIQHKIWLLLGEIYLQQNQPSDASSCLQEAVNIFPISHSVMYMRGLLHEYKNEYLEAKQCYQNAISINPCHIKSLQHLGLMYHYLGNQKLAEKTLRFVAKLDPWSTETWYNLGKVLEIIGDVNNATNCLATALHTETISPVMPYTSIPVTFD